MRTSRTPLILACLLLCGAAAQAEVTRCTDASGQVTYTDERCPAGSQNARRVTTEAPVVVRSADGQVQPLGPKGAAVVPAPKPHATPTADAAMRQPPAPSGPVIIDSRGNTDGQPPDARWSDRGDDPVVEAYGDPYPYARRPPRPRDQRAPLRGCDAAGNCRDALGNQYDRTGKLQGYQGLDGKNCRTVGTTTICK